MRTRLLERGSAALSPTYSVAVMLKDYAAWAKGAKDADVAAIRDAMQSQPRQLRKAA